jgi:hypothetical protein
VLSTWAQGTTRPELFGLVAASAWWIRENGGSKAITATIDAVSDAAHWWR